MKTIKKPKELKEYLKDFGCEIDPKNLDHTEESAMYDADYELHYQCVLNQYERELGEYYQEINKPISIEEYLQNHGHESILEEYKQFISSKDHAKQHQNQH